MYPNCPIMVKGKITAIGTPDSLIRFVEGGGVKRQEGNAGLRSIFKYCLFEDTYEPIGGEIFDVYHSILINYSMTYLIGHFENNNCYFNNAWGINSAYSSYKNNFIEMNRNVSGGTIFYTLPAAGEVNKYNNFIRLGAGRIESDSIGYKYQFNNFINPNTTLVYTSPWGGRDYQFFLNQYWGTNDSLKINSMIYDFWDDPSNPILIYLPLLNAPSDSAHAITWKILVNGKDAQDEYVDPVGVGTQRFDVYFNREMDTTYTPQLTFGVRYPYTQQPVADSGRWDATHRIWTAYKTIKLYTGDGINRLRVAGAKEANGWEWEIPVEDSRFEFLINAAGSSSMDFTATAGLGKVKLEWNNADIEDLLGFNMYRFQNITDTTFTSPIPINTELITDTLFTDFNVTPGTHYYYYYKVVRTDFAESDSSHIVNAIPVTASAGDANGDLTVNVLDITTIISYLLNQNPQPFIFDAADVNSDNSVNVLDVIGVVNLITGNKKSISNVVGTNAVPAYIYLQPERIKFRSDAQVAGLQFTLKGSNLKEVKLSSLVEDFEFAYTASDTAITGILFSFSGKTIPAGLQDILHIEAGNAVLNWGDVTGGDKKGQYVTVIKAGEVLPIPLDYSLKAYPNPTSGDITLSFDLPENAKVNISIYNLYGQLVTRLQDATLSYGNHQLHWQAPKAGVYICRMQATATEAKKARYYRDIKLIVIK